MCHVCDQERKKEQQEAEDVGRIRIVCVCGNLLDTQECPPGEVPSTSRTVGPCCRDTLPPGAKIYHPPIGTDITTPQAHDERKEPRNG